MSFFESIGWAFRQYAEFRGRARVSEFWWFVLFVTLVTAALAALNFTSGDHTVYLGSSLATVWLIGMLLPLLAVSTRRLRDADRSPLQLLWMLVPIAGSIMLAIYFTEPSRRPQAEPQVSRSPAN